MRIPIKIVFDLPVTVQRFKLDETKKAEFNSGKFVRTNYKYLYMLKIDKGKGKTFIQCATPSLSQVFYSIKVLWNSYDGKPYNRHEHPVVLQAYDIDPVSMDLSTKPESERERVVKKFRKTYAKNKAKK